MTTNLGYIHIYYGDGKGKTTAGMGQCLRCAGYGYKILLHQFLKNNQTSERTLLNKIPNIEIIDGLDRVKFSFQMTEDEKLKTKQQYETIFKTITKRLQEETFNVLFLDEILYAIRAGLFEEQSLIDFLDHKPPHLEVILTGRSPSSALLERATYVTKMCKIKHPYDYGIAARDGIER